MSQANKDLFERWFTEVWNKGRAEAIDEMLTPDAVVYGLDDTSGTPISTPEEFRKFHKQFRGAFPGIVVTIDDLVAEGDKVAGRCSVRGNHSGNHLGIAATNVDIAISGMAFIRVKDGKVAEAWNNFDFLKLNRQLGIL
jgi:steroid delta-isomerase-like uncharacterized protein